MRNKRFLLEVTCATALVRLARLLVAMPSRRLPDAFVSLGVLGP